MVSIADNIRQLRLARGFSQADLAEKMGVHRQRISEWENGKVSPTADSIIKTAIALGIEPADLFK